MVLNSDDVASLVERQLEVWPAARKNYDDLVHVRRRNVTVGPIEICIQCNPARIVSTAAATDTKSVAERPCFLCRDNRPEQQAVYSILDGWELLVNPFPIFPIHLTIAGCSHSPQGPLPADIVAMAERLPGMAVFYNGAKAGASAPDHQHMQAVLKDELPLLRWIENHFNPAVSMLASASALGPTLPYEFYTGTVLNDSRGEHVLSALFSLGGPDAYGIPCDYEKMNVFVWLDNDAAMRWLVIPRRAHRPGCYSGSHPRHMVVSPGCIDMAGVLVLPRECDYDMITEKDIAGIFSDVAVPVSQVYE